MLGIKFEIENEYSNYLEKILEDINESYYLWKVPEAEIYIENGTNIFLDDIYSNDEFQKMIGIKRYYTVFANIQLYDRSINLIDINTYEDFINSNCQLILFVTDNIFVDIYGKNDEMLDKVYRNAKKYNFDNLKIIHSKDNIKKSFSAYED
jgi:hypothetical protein